MESRHWFSKSTLRHDIHVLNGFGKILQIREKSKKKAHVSEITPPYPIEESSNELWLGI